MSSPTREPPAPLLRRSSVFRLTLVHGGLFALAMLVCLAIFGLVAELVVRQQLASRVEEESARLSAVHAARGLDGLLEDLAGPAKDGLFPTLLDGRGRRLFGALNVSPGARGWITPASPFDEDEPFLIAHAQPLGPDLLLVVAADTELIYDIREMMLAGTGWTVVVALPLALVSGLLLSRTVLARIAGIEATARRIRAGAALSSRIRRSRRDDEFDALAGEINAMLEAIEQLTGNVENVSIGIAHDLRTPLGRMRNRLEELETKVDPAALQPIQQELDGILATFEALLRIGQIDSGSRRAAFVTIDLSALLLDLADTYAPVAEAGDRRLETSVAQGLTVTGDRALLVQLFANLIENAIEHTPTESTIRLTLAPSTGERSGMIVATVRDDGPGLEVKLELCPTDGTARHPQSTGPDMDATRSGATVAG